jgi:hypothetical protein
VRQWSDEDKVAWNAMTPEQKERMDGQSSEGGRNFER